LTRGTFQLTADDGMRLLRIVADGAAITRHREIYRWLNGEMQHFLPHEILVAAWGDFSSPALHLDVVSDLPGVRTAQLAQCSPDDVIRHAHARWLQAGRAPVLLGAAEWRVPGICSCPIHVALSNMRSLLVHGSRDQRSGADSLYIAFSSACLTRGRCKQSFLSLVDTLMAQIDGAFRRIAALPLAAPASAAAAFDLSKRERQILDSLCQGKTNFDIAGALGISPYTVKNHVQRIFRKIGVTNRTQAALRYNERMPLPRVERTPARTSA
jgi:transcriptional regulator EpsA